MPPLTQVRGHDDFGFQGIGKNFAGLFGAPTEIEKAIICFLRICYRLHEYGGGVSISVAVNSAPHRSNEFDFFSAIIAISGGFLRV